jgi:hypothetical protein
MDNSGKTGNSNNPLQALEAAGFVLTGISNDQRQVLTSLSPEEVRTLVSVKERFDAVTDVKGYTGGQDPKGPGYGVI